MPAVSLISGLCLGTCLAVTGAIAQQIEPLTVDNARQSAALASVGRLLVPAVRYKKGYPSHFLENCSATLVSHDRKAAYSRSIVSAWHCIEDYRDLSQNLVFENAAGRQSIARVIKSGGGMQNDWVLLRLDEALPGPATLPTMSRTAGPFVTAGYPRPAPGAQTVLQVQSACKPIGAPSPDITIDCVLTKGASGGGVFNTDPLASYAGVISRGDSATLSIFVPVARFRSALASLGSTFTRTDPLALAQ